jgi:phage shock protein PspC (stress-responsive transcriptional regulator)
MPTTSDQMQSEQLTAPPADRRLYRSNTDKVVAGICGGLGEYFAVDPLWFRIGFVLLALGGGSGLLIYLLLWLIVQPQPAGYSPRADVRGRMTGAAVIGIVLVVVGTIALLNTMAPSLGQYFWPLILLVGGLALVLGGVNRDNR